jgi:hypothetical protein
MRDRFLGALVLLYGVVSLVRADYYRFIYVPGQPGFAPGQTGFQPGVQPGGLPPGVRPPFGPGMGKNKDKDKDANPFDVDDQMDLTAARLVVIEVYRHKPFNGLVMIRHKYGMTGLNQAGDIKFKRLIEGRKLVPTVFERYALKEKELKSEKQEKNAEKRFEMAEYALTHGLYINTYDSKLPKDADKFRTEMDNFVEANSRHPAAVAYKKVLAGFSKTPTKDPSSAWKDKLPGGFKVLTIPEAPHYAVLHNVKDAEPIEVHQRLKRLETNYQGFFYYFATKGIALPQPDQKMVVVCVDQSADFQALHKVFGSPIITADGFIARRENLAVTSLTSLDEHYNQLAESTGQLWKNGGWNKENLLKGIVKVGEQPQDVAYAQECALLLRAMQDEDDLMTCTNLGSRQLAAATGMLAPAVASPYWVQFGLGSFFETPKGAYWPGTSAPHWRYLPIFLNRRASKLEKPEEALVATITDRYFREAQAANDSVAWDKANTMAWALTYFLLQDQNQRERYFNFLQDLGSSPRDMDLTDEVYLRCFARAFNLMDRRDPNQIDQRAVEKFSREWYYNHMSTVQIDTTDLWTVTQKIDKQRIAKGAVDAEAKRNPGGSRNSAAPRAR